MIRLIDKDAVVAEIKRRAIEYGTHDGAIAEIREDECYSILSFLNTLEVKEVDLEKHLKEDIEDVFFDLDGVAIKGATHYLTVEDVKDIAKHFFELGFKAAQKGE